MNIKWEKKGFIYKPSGEGLFKTHATRPIPYQINRETLRIFFASRNEKNRPLPLFIDVNIANPQEIYTISSSPLMPLGGIGTFDDSGVHLVSFIKNEDHTLFYYSGWKERRNSVTLDFSIGLARMEHNCGSFSRVYNAPILSQDINHPILACAPFVIREDEKYKMWYSYGIKWIVSEVGPEPIYDIRYLESSDGIHWHGRPKIAIQSEEGEVLSAPWVVKIDEVYHMWYSKRGSKDKIAKRYTIGYATSKDGINWVRRDDEAGIERSSEGWDSEMICYPSFFSHKDKTYMFYSGNDVGKSGIGYAVAPRFF